MNIKTTLKTSVAAAALFAVAAPVATTSQAADDTFKTGNKNSVTMSGYVTKTLAHIDNGEESQLFITDGETSESRIRWIAKGTFNENVTAGAMIELEIPLSNDAGAADFANNGGLSEANADTTLWGIRHQYVWVSHKKFGKVSLGNTNAAGNGSAEADLSGLGWVRTSGGVVYGTGINFVNNAAGVKSLSAISVGNVSNNHDATSRTDVLRYDTPSFAGFGLAASINGAGGGEFAAKYSGKHGPVKVLAKASFSELSSTSTNEDERIAVSLAAIHDSGINVHGHYGTDTLRTSSAATAEQWSWSAGVGYRAKIFSFGGTDFDVMMHSGFHQNARGDNNTNTSVAVSQSFDAIGAKMALYYASYELERANQTYEDIDVIALQTIFNF